MDKLFGLIIGFGCIKIGIDIFLNPYYNSYHAGGIVNYSIIQYPFSIGLIIFGIFILKNLIKGVSK
jgi:hypothetical protein